MLSFKSLIILISILNISCAILSPGAIDHSQYNSIPTSLYFAQGNLNGIQPIESNCGKAYYSYVQNSLYPMVFINETAYLGYSFIDGVLDISIITEKGIFPLDLQSSLLYYLQNNLITSSTMFYDDTRNSFIFMNNNLVCEYSITSNSVVSSGTLNYTPFSAPYYDMSQSTLYLASYTTNENGTFNDYSIYQFQQNSETLYSIDELNLTIPLDSYQIAGYKNSVVFFGESAQNSLSILYLVEPATKSFTTLAKRSLGYKFITSANPRYVLLVNEDGTVNELFDLLEKTSQVFSSSCTQDKFQNSFITSIEAVKSLFYYKLII